MNQALSDDSSFPSATTGRRAPQVAPRKNDGVISTAAQKQKFAVDPTYPDQSRGSISLPIKSDATPDIFKRVRRGGLDTLLGRSGDTEKGDDAPVDNYLSPDTYACINLCGAGESGLQSVEYLLLKYFGEPCTEIFAKLEKMLGEARALVDAVDIEDSRSICERTSLVVSIQLAQAVVLARLSDHYAQWGNTECTVG